MTAFDEVLQDIRNRQDVVKQAYATTLAEISAKQQMYSKGMDVLSQLGCETVEDAQVKIEELKTQIASELEKLKELLS